MDNPHEESAWRMWKDENGVWHMKAWKDESTPIPVIKKEYQDMVGRILELEDELTQTKAILNALVKAINKS